MDSRHAPPDLTDPGLREGYRPLASCFDEAFTSEGELRAEAASR